MSNNVNDMDRLRESLRNVMKAEKLNVSSWAKLAGISDSALRHFITGVNQTMNIKTVGKLAAAVNMHVDSLLNYNLPPASRKTRLEDSAPASGYTLPPELAERRKASTNDIWWAGNLSPLTRCQIFANGPMGIEELQNLLTYLEHQRDMLLKEKP